MRKLIDSKKKKNRSDDLRLMPILKKKELTRIFD
jgi:hypothetical protein